MNHCCHPSAFVDTKKAPWRPGELCREDGLLVAKAYRDIAVGERVTLNYGPKELPEWPLAKRRAYMLERHGFICGCSQCEADEQAEAAAAACSPCKDGAALPAAMRSKADLKAEAEAEAEAAAAAEAAEAEAAAAKAAAKAYAEAEAAARAEAAKAAKAGAARAARVAEAEAEAQAREIEAAAKTAKAEAARVAKAAKLEAAADGTSTSPTGSPGAGQCSTFRAPLLHAHCRARSAQARALWPRGCPVIAGRQIRAQCPSVAKRPGSTARHISPAHHKYRSRCKYRLPDEE